MDKVLDNRLRRVLKRMGLQLARSRARDHRGLTYGRYQIVALTTAPDKDGYTLSLDDVLQFVGEMTLSREDENADCSG